MEASALTGWTVGVTADHGDHLTDLLEARGARVLRGSDLRLVEAAVDHRLDALALRDDALVRLVDAAEDAGLRLAFLTAVDDAVAVTTGGGDDAMVEALTGTAAARRRHLQVDGVEVLLQGALVVVGDLEVDLPIRERRVLSILAERPGAVVGKTELLRRAWTTPPDPHAVEVAVGRLRKRLATTGLRVEVVPRRGYRLVA